MTCAHGPCSRRFLVPSGRLNQRYCCQPCRKAAMRLRSRARRRAGMAPGAAPGRTMKCRSPRCGREFRALSSNHAYCSEACRMGTYRRAGLTDEVRVRRRGRPARCKWCGGPHVSDACSGSEVVVKRYGTVVDGRYVPPPGLRVRVLSIPTTVHGRQLTTILREMEP